MRSDTAFLNSVGIEPCVLCDPSPQPVPHPRPAALRARLTKADKKLLKAMYIAWEPQPALQLRLFCGDEEDVQVA